MDKESNFYKKSMEASGMNAGFDLDQYLSDGVETIV